MKRLLKEYGFSCNEQYYNMIAESVINGQRKQAIEQLKAIQKQYKKEAYRFVSDLYGTNSDASLLIFKEL